MIARVCRRSPISWRPRCRGSRSRTSRSPIIAVIYCRVRAMQARGGRRSGRTNCAAPWRFASHGRSRRSSSAAPGRARCGPRRRSISISTASTRRASSSTRRARWSAARRPVTPPTAPPRRRRLRSRCRTTYRTPTPARAVPAARRRGRTRPPTTKSARPCAIWCASRRRSAASASPSWSMGWTRRRLVARRRGGRVRRRSLSRWFVSPRPRWGSTPSGATSSKSSICGLPSATIRRRSSPPGCSAYPSPRTM